MAFIQAISGVPHATAVIPVVCIVVFFVGKLLRQYLSPQARRLRSLPLISENDDLELRKSMQEAYDKYSKAGEFYRLKTNYHEMVVLPPKYMSEVKALPETKLSFSEEIYRRLNGELTEVGRFEPTFIKTISGDLTKRIPHMLNELTEETDYAFKQLLGTSEKSVSLPMLDAAQHIIALLSSRVFVGSPLCHNEKWLEAMIVHTNYTFSASERLWGLPEFIRPVLAPYLKEFRQMSANRKEVERLIAPHISARQKAAFSHDDGEYSDILQRLIQNSPADKKADVAYHAHHQLEMSAAGLHTTAQILTQTIFNLAAYPEYVQELREELHEILREDYEATKTLVVSKPLLAKLVKLDSFMKETQRKDPLLLLSVNRCITAANGLTLSNGLHLPHETFTAVSTWHIANDPELYPEPEKFDGFRFARLAAQGGLNATKYQFTTVNPEFAAFGQGTHSCPGRFFAGAEIKVVMAHILLNYDIAFESGQTRPLNNTRGPLQSPNGQAKVVFTPRSDAWSLSGELE